MERSGRRRYRDSIIGLAMSLAALVLVLPLPALGQVGSTSLEGIVDNLSGARIARANVSLLNADNGLHARAVTDSEGRFSFPIIAPGRYTATASAPGMAEATQSGLELYVGGSMQLQFRLRLAGHAENLTVIAPPAILDPDSGEVFQVIDERAIAYLPHNGRRYTDLALLSPGVTQDPRGTGLRLQWRPLVRRDARLPEQLPGGRRRRQRQLLRPGPRTISRAVPIQQRSHHGVSRLLQRP